MDVLKDFQRSPNPYEEASFFSRFFFCYLNRLFKKGYGGKIHQKDVPIVAASDSALKQTEILEKAWSKELRKPLKSQSLFRVVMKRGFIPMFIYVVCHVTEIGLKIGQAICLRKLLENLEENPTSTDQLYWAGGIAGSLFLAWFVLHPVAFHCERNGVNCKSAILAMIYKKILQIPQTKLSALSVGHIVTLVTTDTRKIQETFKMGGFIIIGPVELIAVAVVLWYEIGVAMFAGVGIILLGAPLQLYMGKFYAQMRKKTVARTDERVNVMNEIISSMQVTKMFAWEESFSKLIHELRRIESSYVMKGSIARAFTNGMFSSSPYVVFFAMFSVYYFQGNAMSLPLVFYVMVLINNLRYSFLWFVPVAVQVLSECYIGCKRIQSFLVEEELSSPDRDKISNHSAMIKFSSVGLSWQKDGKKPMVEDLTFVANIKKPLVMIVGPVGSGKSSILLAILRELNPFKGSISLSGKVAYVSQEAWIFSGSIQQNILFGLPFNKIAYNKVIEHCCLDVDLKTFPNKDETLVGERGVSLSGGQKARINLARAMYSNADVYLLDDPLSAVDSKVSKQIFHSCIRGALKNKVVLLVTHQLQYLEFADNIICLDGDGVAKVGTFDELSEQGVNVVSLLQPPSPEKQWDADSAIDTDDGNDVMGRSVSAISVAFSTDENNWKQSTCSSLDKLLMETQEETIQEGAIGLHLYKNYFVYGVGWCSFIFFLFLQFFTQAALTFTDYWIGRWAKCEHVREQNGTMCDMYIFEDRDANIYIFAALATFATIISLYRSINFFTTLVRCSRQMHHAMFNALLKAPLYFFDTNPVGQILNRFSRDIHSMDDELPNVFFDFVQLGLFALAIIIINCVSVPYMTVVAIPLLLIFGIARQLYMRTSRQLKRLEASSRSPLYTHLSGTLEGIITIRGFQRDNIVIEEFLRCIDHHTETWLTFVACSRWFGQRLDFVALIFSICAVFAPVLLVNHLDIHPALVGVSLTYVLHLCGFFQWCIRQSAELDNLMTSVERVEEYSKLEPEPDVGNDKNLRESWPEYGLITAECVSFSYHHTLPYVLKKVFFCVRPKEKVGIVGRTGAGKSSLLSMIMRLGNSDGVLRIDGVDINTLRLKTLRRHISVIPQDPVLFSGSLRKNLDPFDEHKDGDVWECLEEVQMKELVMDLPKKLHSEVLEGGSNLSVGERQLLCLARALLCQNKILMIDEATANVDRETDAIIQRTLRAKFKECTVLTIAHRLNTIMDSDRVMVIDEGRIVEFDEPIELLQNRDGYFRKLVDQAGRAEASRLQTLAEEAKQIRRLLIMQQHRSYPGSHIQTSRSKLDLVKMFGANLVYETTL